MPQVQSHKLNLPAGFVVYENRDTLFVDCQRCGHERKYMARHVEPIQVEAEAWGHFTACKAMPRTPMAGDGGA